jgi:hypothetical protein
VILKTDWIYRDLYKRLERFGIIMKRRVLAKFSLIRV